MLLPMSDNVPARSHLVPSLVELARWLATMLVSPEDALVLASDADVLLSDIACYTALPSTTRRQSVLQRFLWFLHFLPQ
jgi:hypothetical protein